MKDKKPYSNTHDPCKLPTYEYQPKECKTHQRVYRAQFCDLCHTDLILKTQEKLEAALMRVFNAGKITKDEE